MVALFPPFLSLRISVSLLGHRQLSGEIFQSSTITPSRSHCTKALRCCNSLVTFENQNDWYHGSTSGAIHGILLAAVALNVVIAAYELKS
jgi:hypothetical protein